MPVTIDETDFVCLATIPKSGTHYTHHFLVNYLLRVQGSAPPETLFSHDAFAVFPNKRYNYLHRGEPYKPTGPLPAGLKDLVVQHGFGDLEAFPGKVIALYRNPLDFIVSRFHYRHNSRTDESLHVERIADVAVDYAKRWAIGYAGLQTLLKSATPVCVTRYEQLVARPVQEFRRMLAFLEVPIDESLVEQTVSDVQSKRFRDTAAEKNLNPNFKVPIARDGSIGQWRSAMTAEDVAIVRDVLRERRMDLDEIMSAAECIDE